MNVLSSIVRHLATTPEDDSHSEQRRQLDRWRIAAEIVQRLRDAGISCEMDGDFQTRHKRYHSDPLFCDGHR